MKDLKYKVKTIVGKSKKLKKKLKKKRQRIREASFLAL
jgi:hypothetical protein